MSRLLILVLFSLSAPVQASSLQFFGNGVNDIDRVKVRIDEPANSNPGPPADVGADDFTIEFWMRTTAGNNAALSAARRQTVIMKDVYKI